MKSQQISKLDTILELTDNRNGEFVICHARPEGRYFFPEKNTTLSREQLEKRYSIDAEYQDSFQITTLNKVNKDDFFRFEGKTKVYKMLGRQRLYSEYGRYLGFGWVYEDFFHGSYGNDLQSRNGSRKVEVGFTI